MFFGSIPEEVRSASNTIITPTFELLDGVYEYAVDRPVGTFLTIAGNSWKDPTLLVDPTDWMKAWNKNKKGLGTPTDKSLEEGRPAANPNVIVPSKAIPMKQFKETTRGKTITEKEALSKQVGKKADIHPAGPGKDITADLMKYEGFRRYVLSC